MPSWIWQLKTDMGHARKVILVRSSDAVIALPGLAGTLSEVALALKMGRPSISLGSWEIPGMIKAATSGQAVELAEKPPLHPLGRPGAGPNEVTLHARPNVESIAEETIVGTSHTGQRAR